MDILNFWKLKKIPVPTRYTCYDNEDLFSEREIGNIQKGNKNDPECDIKVKCERFSIVATKSSLNTAMSTQSSRNQILNHES